jgi:hypothetical protein
MEDILNILKLHIFFSTEIDQDKLNRFIDAKLDKNEESGYDEEENIVNETKLKIKVFNIIKNELQQMMKNIENSVVLLLIDKDLKHEDKKVLLDKINHVKNQKLDIVNLCLDQIERLKNTN